MRKVLTGIYYFLPVQLLLLHFRKYQLLLLFWLILVATITGNFASHFGASTLFLAPEYLGHINFLSMFLLGASTAIFMMTWHITTFIIHSKRIHFLGATRHAFLLYCYNNSILPIAYLVFYSIVSIRFQWHNEHAPVSTILILQSGFYLGIIFIILISSLYFFRVSRDLLKTVLARITNPSIIREVIPYDTLDYEVDMVHAESFLSSDFKIEKTSELEPYHPRLLNTILRRHHRNAVFATVIAYILLLVMGVFMEEPLLRIPAGAGFLMLFSIVMGIVGAVKYFFKSWEAIAWVSFIVLLSWMVHYKFFDLRSIAYGLNYHGKTDERPIYDYEHLRSIFTPGRYEADKHTEQEHLERWKQKAKQEDMPPAIVITVSGGGSRSAYWTFHALQYLDSMTHGTLFNNTVLITGASGGMIGAAYWRSVHEAYLKGAIKNPYDRQYQENIGKDLLNSIVFSLVSVDIISPFNKISVGRYAYTRDRGYAMEQELIRNTDQLLDRKIGDFKTDEASGMIPELMIGATVTNDGRKLIISPQPVGFLTRAEYSLNDTSNPTIDAVDFATFFSHQDPYNLRLTSALRMNATFPFLLPVVKLPSQPYMNVMDAGLRDNFGTEIASRYIYAMRDWLKNNTRNVIFLQIRDTREYDIYPPTDQSTLGAMLGDPLFVIQSKWEIFQSYYDSYLRDYAPYCLDGKLKYITLQYFPQESQKVAALNFHLTQKEKDDLYESIYMQGNKPAIDSLLQLLR